MATRLILVRHADPERSPDEPASAWHLSARGRARACALARQLAPVSAVRIYTSRERKALETAHALGEVLDLPVHQVDGLHEHDRRDTPLLDAEVFEASMQQFFASPGECVFGRESADAASARFTRAMASLIATADTDDLIVVAHGTVMALFLARTAGLDAFSFWRGLSMPCAVIVRLPALELDRIVTLE